MEQPPVNPSSASSMPSGAASRCHWHSEVETRLSCSRCGKPVCPQCLAPVPVGIRCRDCGRVAPMPTYEVSASYLARAVVAAVAVAAGGGILWALVNGSFFGRIPFVSSLMAVAVGYAAGELISRATNKKRGTSLAWLAGVAVAAAFLVSWAVWPFGFDIWGLLFIFFGVFVAVQRVR
ncbi:MAG: hypothetical protein EXR54_08275 [Dehalococcoidia bacterium]|nr:hypothetical protein [Dehalococcoidia bacterium]